MVSLQAPCEDAQEESAPSIAQKGPFHKAKNKNPFKRWPVYPSSHKQGAHRIRVVDSFDRFSEQLGNRKNLDFITFYSFFAQRDRIGHHQLLNGGLFDSLYRRP